MKLKILSFILHCFLTSSIFAQSDQSKITKLFNKLVVQKQICSSVDDLYKLTNIWDSLNQINYLKPLINCVSLDISKSDENVKSAYYEQLGFLLSLWNQNFSVVKVYDSMKLYDGSKITKRMKQEEIENYNKITGEKAIQIISDSSKSHNILMLNEAHHIPQHRMFGLSILNELYQNGYRYLAMETLTNNLDPSPIKKINSRIGYYSIEPVMAEFIRRSLEIGYKLVPYEYDQSSQPSELRDSIQAENILKIFNKDKRAKVFVYAGYGHIEKKAFPGYRPLGFMLNKISLFNPYSIDQVKYSKGYFQNLNQQVYNVIDSSLKLKNPSALYVKNKPFQIYNLGLYDLHLFHPAESFINGRPSWLFSNGKKEIKILFPKRIQFYSFLVLQAYYSNEISFNDFGLQVPADQILLLEKTKSGFLALRKGKYIIVWRNKNYEIIEKRLITVD